MDVLVSMAEVSPVYILNAMTSCSPLIEYMGLD